MHIDAIIPALDEADTIGGVVRALLEGPVRGVIVADNGSRDATAERAKAAGASVVHEPRRGYGAACLAALAALPDDTGIVLFLDADGSDDPDRVAALCEPIRAGAADLVIGSRILLEGERGALTPAQRLGNAIAAAWLRARFGVEATDLGPLRAIRRASLDALDMRDRDFGWTIEMQIKAARRGLRTLEVPVRARRRRGGRSKVSGTLRGTLGAAVKILGLLARYDLGSRRAT